MSANLHGSIFVRDDATAVASLGLTGPSITFGTVSLIFADLDRHSLAAELRRLADELDPQPPARPTWDDLMRDEALRLLDRQWGAA